MRFALRVMSVSSFSDRNGRSAICDWVEEARSRATGLVLTQPDGSLYTSRCEKPGQPARFSFYFNASNPVREKRSLLRGRTPVLLGGCRDCIPPCGFSI